MKNFLFSIVLLFFGFTLTFAQAPEKFSYQAVIRNADNSLLQSTNISMQISILENTPNGQAVYVETQNASTNVNGLVSVEIGNGDVVLGDFASIDWASGTYFIKTETDPNGGNDYTIVGTSQLLSVPYALHATTADTVLNSPQGFQHYVGEVFGGGVVFHVYRGADGLEHGLIVAMEDQGTEIPWSNLATTPIGALARSSWNGSSNSTSIVNQVGHTQSAAKLCLDYESSDGFDDWYLPSVDELILLYNRRFDVNRVLSVVGEEFGVLDPMQTFSYLQYWSSTEIDEEQAWRYSFTPGANDFSHFGSKASLNHVRAVRKF